MEEMEREVRELKSLTTQLRIVILVMSIALVLVSFNQFQRSKQYALIHDYYQESLELDRELNQNLEKLTPKIEDIHSKLQ